MLLIGASGREIDQKYPAQADSFAKQRPEWEIVGAFAPDPITMTLSLFREMEQLLVV